MEDLAGKGVAVDLTCLMLVPPELPVSLVEELPRPKGRIIRDSDGGDSFVMVYPHLSMKPAAAALLIIIGAPL